MAVPTTLDPWRDQGIPLEKQCRSWKEIVKSPYSKLDVDAYARTRIILMNVIETEAWSSRTSFTARPTTRRSGRSARQPARSLQPSFNVPLPHP